MSYKETKQKLKVQIEYHCSACGKKIDKAGTNHSCTKYLLRKINDNEYKIQELSEWIKSIQFVVTRLQKQKTGIYYAD